MATARRDALEQGPSMPVAIAVEVGKTLKEPIRSRLEGKPERFSPEDGDNGARGAKTKRWEGVLPLPPGTRRDRK